MKQSSKAQVNAVQYIFRKNLSAEISDVSKEIINQKFKKLNKEVA